MLVIKNEPPRRTLHVISWVNDQLHTASLTTSIRAKTTWFDAAPTPQKVQRRDVRRFCYLAFVRDWQQREKRNTECEMKLEIQIHGSGPLNSSIQFGVAILDTHGFEAFSIYIPAASV